MVVDSNDILVSDCSELARHFVNGLQSSDGLALLVTQLGGVPVRRLSTVSRMRQTWTIATAAAITAAVLTTAPAKAADVGDAQAHVSMPAGKSELPTPSDSDGNGTLDAPEESSAVASAVVAQKPVEDLSKRSETSTTVANPDGSFTLRSYQVPVRVERSGKWLDVDDTLVKQSDGSYRPRVSASDIVIGGGGSKLAGQVTFEDGHSVAVTWPATLPEPSIDGALATYQLSDSEDLLVTASGSGVSAQLRLNEKPAEDDPSFTFGLRTSGLNVAETSDGGLALKNSRNETVGATAPLVAWDDKADDAGEPVATVPLDADLDQKAKSGDVTTHDLNLTPPAGYLDDPETEYPVIIDPNVIALGAARDTWVRNGDTASHGQSTYASVGKMNTTGNTNPAISFIQWSMYSAEYTPPNAVVKSARLLLHQFYASTCGPTTMVVQPLTTAWNADVTFPSRPSSYSGDYQYLSENKGYQCGNAGRVAVPATTYFNTWRSGGAYGNYGLRLGVPAANENQSSYHRRFCSYDANASDANCPNSTFTPIFEVTYNNPPETPKDVEVTFGGNPVTVRATVSDPNPETNLRVSVAVRKSNGDPVWDTYVPVSGSGPVQISTRVPYLPDGDYKVVMQSIDDLNDVSGVSEAESFRVDTDLGSQSWFSATQHGLTDRSGLQVNNRTGNLVLQGSDIKVNGHGLDLDVTRSYNSEAVQTATQGIVTDAARTGTSMGNGWTLSVGPDVFLEKRGSNYLYHSPGGTIFGPFKPTDGSTTKFDRLKDGSGADLQKNTETGKDPFTLTFRKSQIKFDFATVGSTGDAYMSKMRDRSDNVIKFNYAGGATTPNGRAKLSSITDASNRAYAVTYTGDNITKIAEAGTDAREWNYQYNGDGYLSKSVDPAQNETNYAYVASSTTGAKLLGTISGPRTGTTIEYNNDSSNPKNPDLDRVNKVTYRKDASTTHSFTWSYGRTAASSRCPGSVDKYSTNVVDAKGKNTTYCFTDGSGDSGGKLRVVDDIGNIKTSDYTADKGLASVTNPSNSATGGSTVAQYGANGLSDQLNSVTEPKNSTSNSTQAAATTFAYGNEASVKGGSYLPTTTTNPSRDCSMFSYNSDGYTTAAYTGIATNPTSSSPNGTCSKDDSKTGAHRSYNNDGSISKSWDANAYGAGQDDKTELEDSRKTLYTYWASDDANNRAGLLKTVRKPGGSCDAPRKLCIDYDYDVHGRVIKVADGRGTETRYSYDRLDRTTGVYFAGAAACNTTSSNCSTYVYDAEGNLTSRNNKGTATTFAYDGMNRQTQQDDSPRSVIGMDYDGNGNLSKHEQTVAGQAKQTVNYTYDGANRLTNVHSDALGSGDASNIGITPDADGRVKQIRAPENGLRMNYDYTKAGKPKTANVKTNSGDATLRSYNYDYTKDLLPGTGEFLAESDQLQQRIAGGSGSGVANGTTTYTYNEGRIVSSKIDDLPDYTYTHDKIGNITSETTSGNTKYFGYDRAGQLCWQGSTSPTGDEKLDTTCHTGPTGATELGHDAAGNNTGTATNPTTYNENSQVLTIDGVTMGYQDLGNDLRTSSGSTSWVNSANGITAKKTGSDTTYYIRDPNGQLLASYGSEGPQFYFSEFNGSVAAIYGASGTQTGAYTYSPYGKTTVAGTAGPANPFRYIGGVQDKSSSGDDGYYKLGARYYDAQGHFTQADPIVPGGGSYNYTAGDPINRSDPSGMYWGEDAVNKVGDGISSGVGAAYDFVQPVISPIANCLTGVGIATLGVETIGTAIAASATGIGEAAAAASIVACYGGFFLDGVGVKIPALAPK